MKRKLNTVAFEGVGRVGGPGGGEEIYERNGMTVHGSSATNPPAIILRVLQYGQYAALFRFSTDSNERQGQGVGAPTLTTLFGDSKKRKKTIQRTRTSLHKQQKVWVSFRKTQRTQSKRSRRSAITQ